MRLLKIVFHNITYMALENILVKKVITVNLLFLLFCILPKVSDAQITAKYYATNTAYKIKGSDNKWSSWSDWKEGEIVIVINTAEDKISIYTAEYQEFDIVEYKEEIIEKDGRTVHPMIVVDKNGNRCRIRFRMGTKGESSQIYLEYSDIQIVYEVN